MALIDYLPSYYRESVHVVELQEAFNHWSEALLFAKEDLLYQINVESATWGLKLWEEALGIETDASKPDAYRRTKVLSKLRGSGTTTKAMIQNVARSFSNGEVTLLEYNSENRFEVKFTGTMGIPPNMNDLTSAIEEIKPAHLAFSYVYIFRQHGQLSAYTHQQLAAYTHEILRSGGIE